MIQTEKKEEVKFNVEEGTVEMDDLRSADYKKFRELYKLLAKIGVYDGIDREDSEDNRIFDEIRNNALYPEALKSSFFIEKLTQRYKEGGFDKYISDKILEDLQDDIYSSKYAKLRKQIMNREITKNNIEYGPDMLVALVLAIVSLITGLLLMYLSNSLDISFLSIIDIAAFILCGISAAYLWIKIMSKSFGKISNYTNYKPDK